MSEMSTTVLILLPIILAGVVLLVFWRKIQHPALFGVTFVLALLGLQSLIASAAVAVLFRNTIATSTAAASAAFQQSVIASAALVAIVGIPFLWWLRRAFHKGGA